MRYRFLPADVINDLLLEALAAPLLPTNELVVTKDHVVDKIRRLMEECVGKELLFFKAFLFLLSKTTYSGIADTDSEGWHNDASCDDVDGECINAWIPLYCSDPLSGLRIATREDNGWLYSKLPVPRARVDVLTRRRRQELFKTGGDDAIVLDVKNGAGFAFSRQDLKVREVLGGSVGNLVLFDQNELHQGFHGDGIRIQLTLKFRTAVSSVRSVVFPETPIAPSKHGVLERQLIQELLEIQMIGIRLLGTPLPFGSRQQLEHVHGHD